MFKPPHSHNLDKLCINLKIDMLYIFIIHLIHYLKMSSTLQSSYLNVNLHITAMMKYYR